MWPLTGTARQLQAQSHTMTAALVVLHSGRPVATLVPYSGTVNAQVGRSVMRNLGCTVIDPTGALTGSEVDDLLSPYAAEVQPYRGVVTPTGTEWVPLGVYRLTARNVVGDGSVQLTGQDRAMIYQGPMSGSLVINAGTPVEKAIAKLLSTRYRGVQLHSWATGCVVGPLLYKPDIDVWAEAQKLAKGVGGWVYHDAVGDVHLGPLLPTTLRPVARYAEGDGLLLDVTRKENSDTIHNVVVVTSTNANTQATITGLAQDADPTSPTYAYGKYGRQVKSISNNSVGNVSQATQMATTELVRELGRSETVDATIVCNPALTPLDCLIVNRPSVGLVEKALIIDQVSHSLAAKDPTTIQFRKYVLTEDGQTLQLTLEELTTS
jgi:hypothetical protein